jgi:hypothetical protein
LTTPEIRAILSTKGEGKHQKTRKELKMKIDIEIIKTLNISDLYDEIVDGDFEHYSSCEEVSLSYSDLTPKLMNRIFSALAEEANKRQDRERM